MADYDIDLQYHPGKVNTVPNALRKKSENKVLVQLTQRRNYLRKS